MRHPIFSIGSQFFLLKSWTLANGEVVIDKPKTVTPTSVNMPPLQAIAPPQPNLAFAWDEVYGQGSFVVHILGKQIGQGIFTGKQARFFSSNRSTGEMASRWITKATSTRWSGNKLLFTLPAELPGELGTSPAKSVPNQKSRSQPSRGKTREGWGTRCHWRTKINRASRAHFVL
jgi:hypothetical protein